MGTRKCHGIHRRTPVTNGSFIPVRKGGYDDAPMPPALYAVSMVILNQDKAAGAKRRHGFKTLRLADRG